MPSSNLRLLPPHAMRLAQIHTELGAHACSSLSGGYDLINELFYKIFDDVLNAVVPYPEQLDESAAKLFAQLKNYGSEDTSGVDIEAERDGISALPMSSVPITPTHLQTNIKIFSLNGIKVRKVFFKTHLVEPINNVKYPWWPRLDHAGEVIAFVPADVDTAAYVEEHWPDVNMIGISDVIDHIEFTSDYPAPQWWVMSWFADIANKKRLDWFDNTENNLASRLNN